MSARIRSMIDDGHKISDADYGAACEEAREIAARLGDMIGSGGLFLTAATLDVAPLISAGTGSRAHGWSTRMLKSRPFISARTR